MIEGPSSVRVAWRDYSIVYMDSRKSGAVSFYGEADHQMTEIQIGSTFGSRLAASVLLHEIMHCICKTWAIPTPDDEEAIVTAFQHGLSTVWRDNPEVMAWIGKNLVSGDD